MRICVVEQADLCCPSFFGSDLLPSRRRPLGNSCARTECSGCRGWNMIWMPSEMERITLEACTVYFHGPKTHRVITSVDGSMTISVFIFAVSSIALMCALILHALAVVLFSVLSMQDGWASFVCHSCFPGQQQKIEWTVLMGFVEISKIKVSLAFRSWRHWQ